MNKYEYLNIFLFYLIPQSKKKPYWGSSSVWMTIWKHHFRTSSIKTSANPKESSLTATAWHWQTATCYQSCTSSRWYASVVYRHTHTQASIKLFHFKYIIMMCSFLFGFVGCCQEVLQFWDSCSVHWCVALPGECTWERRVQPDLSSWHWNWENLSECGQEELNFRLLRS